MADPMTCTRCSKLTNALQCAREAISRLDVGAMGFVKEPHSMLGTNMVPVTEVVMGIIDAALDEAQPSTPNEDGL